jgi:hypothetical protein
LPVQRLGVPTQSLVSVQDTKRLAEGTIAMSIHQVLFVVIALNKKWQMNTLNWNKGKPSWCIRNIWH